MIKIAVFFLLLISLKAENDYNVLFIAIDDLRPELGCYDVKYAQSPSIDSFAKEAVVFNRHYVQVATCGASRYALLTGRSPFYSKATGNGSLYSGKTALKPDFKEAAQSLPEAFRKSGYKTACIGKISHQPDGRVFSYNGKGKGQHEVPNAWDELPTPFGAWKRGWGTFFAYADGKHREDGKGNKDLMEFKAKKDTDLPDGMMAETAIEQLRKWKNEKFFIGLGFYKPHLPFVAPKQDWDAFEGKTIPNPPNMKKPASGFHGSGEFYKYKAPFEKTKPLNQDSLTKSRRAYLACVRYVDRQVGKVLDELKKLGLEKKTIVIIWGDHGWFLGDMQMWGKHSAFEEANRSVLIIKSPGCKPAKTDALAETIDLFPTLMDLCNAKYKKTRFKLDGVSLKPILESKSDSVREAAISYWGGAISVRTKNYRLIHKKGTARLYKMDGPFTLTENIASSNPEVVNKLKQLIPKE
jgi:arylsulfatase A-like enzyme